MINKNTPINSFAEAYHFGIGYLLFYQILIVIMLYISSLDINHKFYNNIILLSKIISYFIIFFSSQYTLRPTMRFILLNFILIIVGYYFSKKKVR